MQIVHLFPEAYLDGRSPASLSELIVLVHPANIDAGISNGFAWSHAALAVKSLRRRSG
ncbi:MULTISPECIES: hypothetical protein [Paraburkholderia]|uniref:hypothetical protein n=1 Tax=Paraburkholderia TaxID=1822464 RepID=UPI0013A6C838|nr:MULTISPECIES: hypothetical protein [Paraburkholderia]MBB5444909.1 hypothetical protein [Paraburkholderia sp. WSM4177]MBB5483841.1 hypothetical protein [Paraburkholderia sp. WSM4180]MDH6146752.1 hypothetical protein [Paraburkholderia sp. WSM4179]